MIKKIKICWFRSFNDIIWAFDSKQDWIDLVSNVEELEQRIIKLESIIESIKFIENNIKKSNI